jgi:hypothetical protein
MNENEAKLQTRNVNQVKMSRNISKLRKASIALSAAFILFAAGVLFAAPSKKAPEQLGVFRPSNGMFYATAADSAGSFAAVKWGKPTDVLTPGDYDGDGVSDAAVWRAETGVWYILQSGDGSAMYVKWGMTVLHPTGGLPDVPVPADYDGDGTTDIAVWRPDTGEWFVLYSPKKFDQRKAGIYRWGALSDVPVQADYDGDGRDDLAVFRSLGNQWFILESSTGSWKIYTFGVAGADRLVPADYTGDGKADIAVYRSGTWYVLNSKTQETEPFEFGFTDGIAAPGDYDGDGQADFAVFRRGTWYIYDSATPRLRSVNFGNENDIPLNSLRAKPSMVAVP